MTKHREFHDGRRDGLEPLESLDLDRVSSFADLLRGMRKTAFSGRNLGQAFEVMLAMVKDPDCKVVLTLSGAMTIAKMGKVIMKMIDTGMVQALVSTGALMAHGMSEAVGMVHYRHDPRVSDEELFEKGYNRVYDTLEMKANLNYVEEFSSKAMDRLGPEKELSSEIISRTLGEVLAKDPQGTGVLRSAYLKQVPVFVPAFTDSELGLDLSTWAMKRAQAQGPGFFKARKLPGNDQHPTMNPPRRVHGRAWEGAQRSSLNHHHSAKPTVSCDAPMVSNPSYRTESPNRSSRLRMSATPTTATSSMPTPPLAWWSRAPTRSWNRCESRPPRPERQETSLPNAVGSSRSKPARGGVILGKTDVIQQLTIALVGGGHVLMMVWADEPGTCPRARGIFVPWRWTSDESWTFCLSTWMPRVTAG